MGRVWRHEWVSGATRIACSICGFPRRFPDELTFCSDKLYRCEVCNEKPVQETDKELAAFRQKPEEPDPAIGLRPQADNLPTLLTYATGRVESLFTGWTPTSTFSDTYSIVPGGVGSSWTTGGTGSVSLSNGVAVIACDAGESLFLDNASFERSSYPTSRWYQAIRFAITTTPDAMSRINLSYYANDGATLPDVFVGINGAYSTGRFVFGRFPTTVAADARVQVTDIHVDDEIHIAELWCTGDRYYRCSIDQRPTMSLGIGTGVDAQGVVPGPFVLVSAGGASQSVSIYDSVYFK